MLNQPSEGGVFALALYLGQSKIVKMFGTLTSLRAGFCFSDGSWCDEQFPSGKK
jgi:hypothetical protein